MTRISPALISLATPDDAPGLAALRGSVARDMTRKYGEGDWSASPSPAEVLQQAETSQVFVARREASIIGTVRLARALPWAIDASSFTPVSTALYVLGLSVAPDSRGQGVGRLLMGSAKDAATSRPAQALWLDAYDHEAGAGPFYIKCGFRQVGRTSYRTMPLIYFEWLAPQRGK